MTGKKDPKSNSSNTIDQSAENTALIDKNAIGITITNKEGNVDVKPFQVAPRENGMFGNVSPILKQFCILIGSITGMTAIAFAAIGLLLLIMRLLAGGSLSNANNHSPAPHHGGI